MKKPSKLCFGWYIINSYPCKYVDYLIFKFHPSTYFILIFIYDTFHFMCPFPQLIIKQLGDMFTLIAQYSCTFFYIVFSEDMYRSSTFCLMFIILGYPGAKFLSNNPILSQIVYGPWLPKIVKSIRDILTIKITELFTYFFIIKTINQLVAIDRISSKTAVSNRCSVFWII